jgi:hypothetical protein
MQSYYSARKLLILILVVYVFAFILLLNNFQFVFSGDEGFNLMKVQLLNKGYQLYVDIWSDQPPLYPFMLKTFNILSSNQIFNARLLTLSLTSAFLFVFWESINSQYNERVANIGLAVLIAAPIFSEASISIMAGWNSIIFSFFGCHILHKWDSDHRKYSLLVTSSILFLISVSIKIFTLFVFFLAVIFVVFQSQKKDDHPLKNLITFIMPWLILTPLILIYFNVDFTQLIDNHIKAYSAKELSKGSLGKYLVNNKYLLIVLIISFIGIFYSAKEKSNSLLTSGWLTLSVLIYLIHKPFWGHHYLIILVPSTIYAAFFLNKIFKKDRYLVLFLAIIFMVGTTKSYSSFLSRKITKESLELVNYLKTNTQTGEMIFANNIYLASLSSNTVPPYFAAFSNKRIATKLLTEDMVNESILINQYKLILISNSSGLDLSRIDLSSYMPVLSNSKGVIYKRKMRDTYNQ